MSDKEILLLELKDGTVEIELRPDLAPKHVARIKELVKQGFYDGLTFHRVIDGFMAQTGDPDGDGCGGSGMLLRAEFSKEPHVRGTCSMARAMDIHSADSQFFICFDGLGIFGIFFGKEDFCRHERTVFLNHTSCFIFVAVFQAVFVQE